MEMKMEMQKEGRLGVTRPGWLGGPAWSARVTLRCRHPTTGGSHRNCSAFCILNSLRKIEFIPVMHDAVRAYRSCAISLFTAAGCFLIGLFISHLSLPVRPVQSKPRRVFALNRMRASGRACDRWTSFACVALRFGMISAVMGSELNV